MTAISIITIVIISICGDWFKAKLTSSNIKIVLTNEIGVLTQFEHSTRMIFYHFKVINSRLWAIAKNCRIFLNGIYKEIPYKQLQNLLLSSNPSIVFKPAEINYQAKNLNKEQVFEFGFLTENSTEYKPVLNFFPNNFLVFILANQKAIFSIRTIRDKYLT